MKTLLRHLFGFRNAAHPAPRPRSPRAAPRLETLEDRCTPAAIVGPAAPGVAVFVPAPIVLIDSGHTLVVNGNDDANELAIKQNDALNTLRVTLDGQTAVFTSSQITKITVNLRGGDDTCDYDLTSTMHKFGKETTIRLGQGNDECDLDFRVGVNGKLRSTLDLSVYGGRGVDELNAQFSHKHGGALSLFADLGRGADTIFAAMAGDITGGADVAFDLNGGRGNDSIVAWNTYDDKDAYDSIDVVGDATFAISLHGGADDDTLSALYSGELDGDLTLSLNGDDGNDSLAADVILNAETDGSVNGLVAGGLDDDLLEFNLLDGSLGDAQIDAAEMRGNAGTDTDAGHTANVTLFSVEN